MDQPTTEAPTAIVTPWEVEGAVDYDKLILQFGSSHIDDALIQRFEKLTGKRPHHFLTRGIFFSHRDMHQVLDRYERGEPFYLYTGRGPSSGSMHVGHLIPFLFTKYLQDAFQVPLVIQITDDEKFLWKDISQEKMEQLARENIRDIIAMGFNPNLTFIFQNYNYMGYMYRVVSRIQKAMTASQVRGCFGFKMEDNVGKWMFPAVQAAPSFSVAFPHIFPDTSKNIFCLIPCGIDQDPYFRLTRDVAPRLGWLKPALIHSKFFAALGGSTSKMSASVDSSAVFVTDTPKQIKEKINRHAFSGGGATKEEQMFLGANCEVDVPIQWLAFFMEDDAEYSRLKTEYAAGRVMTGEVKKTLIAVLTKIVTGHQSARTQVTEAMIDAFMTPRRLAPASKSEAAPLPPPA